jgi:hypothetical protein
MIACPSCGLPAEPVYRFQRDFGNGPTEHVRTRCVLLHFSATPVEAIVIPDRDLAELEVRPSPEQPSPVQPEAAVIHLSTRRRSLALPDWARYLVAFFFGGLGAILALQVPMALVVLIPLGLPIAGVVSARRSWKPLAIRLSGVPPLPSPAAEYQHRRKAA